MKPWLQDADVTLYHGDVLQVLRELSAESVDCVVTSPPYWGLRDYGTGAWEGGDEGCDHVPPPTRYSPTSTLKNDGRPNPGANNYEKHTDTPYRDTCGKCGATRIDQQLGLEPTPEQYVTRMVEVFREVCRVLAAHGTCWVNLGDSYIAAQGGRQSSVGEMPAAPLQRTNEPRERDDVDTGAWADRDVTSKMTPARGTTTLKPKDLAGVPWRVAFALQADGWYLRSDIIWAKPNPMPESVTDRPTKAHEYVFLLSKQPRYFFDQEAVREPYLESTIGRSYTASKARDAAPKNKADPMSMQATGWVAPFARPVPQRETLDDSEGEAPRGPDGRRKTHVEAANGSIQHRDGERWPNGGRNIRSVWDIATQPYPEAHFATFPEELARRCIAAGCPEQVCRVCGKARERIVVRGKGEAYEKEFREDGRPDDDARAARNFRKIGGGQKEYDSYKPPETLGFTDCGHDDYRTGLTLDPFIGSGTVAYVARKLGRHAVGIDLNESYLELAARRLQQQSLFSEVAS